MGAEPHAHDGQASEGSQRVICVDPVTGKGVGGGGTLDA